MTVLIDADIGPRSATNTASPRESQSQRHGGPALEKPSINWNSQDNYTELPIFEMEVTNILHTKISAKYDMNMMKKKSQYQELVRKRGLVTHNNLHECRKRNIQNYKSTIFNTKS